MRELITKAATAVDVRDALALSGLGCLASACGLVGWVAAGAPGAAGGALGILGAGLFYLGVWHTGRRG